MKVSHVLALAFVGTFALITIISIVEVVRIGNVVSYADAGDITIDEAVVDATSSESSDGQLKINGRIARKLTTGSSWLLNKYDVEGAECSFAYCLDSDDCTSENSWSSVSKVLTTASHVDISSGTFNFDWNVKDSNIDFIRQFSFDKQSIPSRLRASCTAKATVYALRMIPISRVLAFQLEDIFDPNEDIFDPNEEQNSKSLTGAIERIVIDDMNITDIGGDIPDMKVVVSALKELFQTLKSGVKDSSRIEIHLQQNVLDLNRLPIAVKNIQVKTPKVGYQIANPRDSRVQWSISTPGLHLEFKKNEFDPEQKRVFVFDLKSECQQNKEDEACPLISPEYLKMFYEQLKRGKLDLFAEFQKENIDTNFLKNLLGPQHWISTELLPEISLGEARSIRFHQLEIDDEDHASAVRRLLQVPSPSDIAGLSSPPHSDLPSDVESIDCLRADVDSISAAIICGRMVPQFLKLFARIETKDDEILNVQGAMKWTPPSTPFAVAGNLELNVVTSDLNLEVNGALSEAYQNASCHGLLTFPNETIETNIFSSWHSAEEDDNSESKYLATLQMFYEESGGDYGISWGEEPLTITSVLDGTAEEDTWRMQADSIVDYHEEYFDRGVLSKWNSREGMRLSAQGTYTGDSWNNFAGEASQYQIFLNDEIQGGLSDFSGKAGMSLEGAEEGSLAIHFALDETPLRDPIIGVEFSCAWDVVDPAVSWNFEDKVLVKWLKDDIMHEDEAMDWEMQRFYEVSSALNYQSDTDPEAPKLLDAGIVYRFAHRNIEDMIVVANHTQQLRWLPLDWLPGIWETGQSDYPKGLIALDMTHRTFHGFSDNLPCWDCGWLALGNMQWSGVFHTSFDVDVSLSFADQDLIVLFGVNATEWEETVLHKLIDFDMRGGYSGSWDNFIFNIRRASMYSHAMDEDVNILGNTRFRNPGDRAGSMTMNMNVLEGSEQIFAVDTTFLWDDVQEIVNNITFHKHMYIKADTLSVTPWMENGAMELSFTEQDWNIEEGREVISSSPGMIKAQLTFNDINNDPIRLLDSVSWTFDDEHGNFKVRSEINDYFNFTCSLVYSDDNDEFDLNIAEYLHEDRVFQITATGSYLGEDWSDFQVFVQQGVFEDKWGDKVTSNGRFTYRAPDNQVGRLNMNINVRDSDNQLVFTLRETNSFTNSDELYTLVSNTSVELPQDEWELGFNSAYRLNWEEQEEQLSFDLTVPMIDECCYDNHHAHFHSAWDDFDWNNDVWNSAWDSNSWNPTWFGRRLLDEDDDECDCNPYMTELIDSNNRLKWFSEVDQNNVQILLFNTKAHTINNTNTYGLHYLWGSVTSILTAGDTSISLMATQERISLDYQVKDKISFKTAQHFTYDKDLARETGAVLSYSLVPYVPEGLTFNNANGYLSGSMFTEMTYQGEVCASTGTGERACYMLDVTVNRADVTPPDGDVGHDGNRDDDGGIGSDDDGDAGSDDGGDVAVISKASTVRTMEVIQQVFLSLCLLFLAQATL